MDVFDVGGFTTAGFCLSFLVSGIPFCNLFNVEFNILSSWSSLL